MHAPSPLDAPRHVQLANCAAWHTAEAERAEHNGDHAKAERHRLIEFRLFKQAHEAKHAGA